jgi:hypothetical protein
VLFSSVYLQGIPHKVSQRIDVIAAVSGVP